MCWFIFALLSSSTASHTPSLAHPCQLIWSLASLSPPFRPPWLFGIRHHHWCIIIILLLHTSPHHLPNLWFCVPIYPLIQVTSTFNGLCFSHGLHMILWFLSPFCHACIFLLLFLSLSVYDRISEFFWMCWIFILDDTPLLKDDWLVAWLMAETSRFACKSMSFRRDFGLLRREWLKYSYPPRPTGLLWSMIYVLRSVLKSLSDDAITFFEAQRRCGVWTFDNTCVIRGTDNIFGLRVSVLYPRITLLD